jgi:methylenetetrahydrofolate dehydrogenase (NADP+)/methenyltetrahydrofolate cyclohydrolase
VASKVKNCKEIGIESSLFRYESSISEEELLNKIEELNNDENIDGILVQVPLPKHISEKKVTLAISPDKDVDGFHPLNVGNMVLGFPAFISATPYGILLLLQHYKIPTSGKNVVVIGRSNNVGTPLSILLSRNNNEYGNATVTLCHSRTKDLQSICLQADIIIAAIGRPKFVTADMVKENAVIIDVGINRVKDESKKSGFALKGDVDFENVAPKCSYISPVPGGVGLMTIAALLMNTFKAGALKAES